MDDKVSYSLDPDDKSELNFDKNPQEKHEEKPDEFEENPLSFLTGKTVSLIVGILVIALLVPFIIFSVSKSKSTKQTTSTSKQTAANVTPTPARGKTHPLGQKTSQNQTASGNTTKGGLPLTGSSTQVVGTKNYTDPTFGYSVSIPSNWEAFKSAGSANAYQIAFHPIGSSDTPFTIGAQSGVSENDWINAEYGTSFPRENSQIAGKNALLVRNPTYLSYFTHDNTYTYEISEAFGNQNYMTIYNSILSSLKLSK